MSKKDRMKTYNISLHTESESYKKLMLLGYKIGEINAAAEIHRDLATMKEAINLKVPVTFPCGKKDHILIMFEIRNGDENIELLVDVAEIIIKKDGIF